MILLYANITYTNKNTYILLTKEWIGREEVTYVAAVVDEASKVATLSCVDDGVVVNAEHVAAANALFLIPLFSHVSNHL